MTFLFIAGMHRSGTSMLANILNEYGFFAGNHHDLIQPQPNENDNVKGYWEDKHIVALNDEILDTLGGGWRNPPEIPVGWETDSRFDKFIYRMRGSLTQESENIVFKDPRNSLTMALWKRAFPDLKIIVMVRNPLEVAKSSGTGLKNYRDFSLEEASTLWQKYYEVILQTIDPGDAIWTHYESYMNSPFEEVSRILNHLGVKIDKERLTQAIKVIDTSLKHYTIPDELVHGNYPSLAVANYYNYFRTLCGSNYEKLANDPTRRTRVMNNYLQTEVIDNFRELNHKRHMVNNKEAQIQTLQTQNQELRSKLANKADLQAQEYQTRLERFINEITTELSALKGLQQGRNNTIAEFSQELVEVRTLLNTFQDTLQNQALSFDQLKSYVSVEVENITQLNNALKNELLTMQNELVNSNQTMQSELVSSNQAMQSELLQAIAQHNVLVKQELDAIHLERLQREAQQKSSLLSKLLPTGIKSWIKQRRDIRIITQSNLFDANWYLHENPDVATSGMSPVKHYVIYGAYEGRNPTPNFDTRWYTGKYPDVNISGFNAFAHYVRYGAVEGRFTNNEHLQV